MDEQGDNGDGGWINGGNRGFFIFWGLMRHLRRLSYCYRLLAVLFVVPVRGHGQQPLPHTLLWRISGKGLVKPSYLFGTLHLNDKRLFYFADSVYGAIEATDGFAMEVKPDDMAAYAANHVFDRITNSPRLKELLDEKYFADNREALAKKFHKAAEDITENDVMKEKNKGMLDLLQKGEMTTFLDAYLYNIARRQGKWVGGVEDIGDQTSLIDAGIDQSDIESLLAADASSRRSGEKETAGKMVSFYLNGDPEGIEAISSAYSTPEQKDRMLIRRNMKMARRIDSLTALRTMFIAIGAAHLAGDSGVISLLRKRGFTMSPVFGTQRIDAKDYSFKEVVLPWVGVEDKQGLYKAEMPANPTTIELGGLATVKFLFDIFTLSSYSTMVFVNPGSAADRDSMINTVVQKMFKNGHFSYTTIEKNGIRGREYTGSFENHPFRCQLFQDDQLLYIALMTALKKELFASPDADKFFASFSIYKRVVKELARSRFTDSAVGVSFVTPVALAYDERQSKQIDGWSIRTYSSADISRGVSVALVSKGIMAGYVAVPDSGIFNPLDRQMESEYTDIQREDIDLQGYRAIKFAGRFREQRDFYIRSLFVVRHNKNIILMCIGDKDRLHSPAIDSLFASFTFIHPVNSWAWVESPDRDYGAWAPSPFAKEASGAKLISFSYDSTSAVSYFVMPDTLGKYEWFASDSMFWDARIKALVGGDSLLEQKDVVNGALKGKELLILNITTGNFERIRLVTGGDKLYELFLAGKRKLLSDGYADKFFASFRLNGDPAGHYITASKMGLILQDLSSKDSVIRANAFHAFKFGISQKEDLPLLRANLFKRFPSPFDTSSSTMVNESIADDIAHLQDALSVAFVKQHYPSLTGKDEELKSTALSLLALLNTKESYAALAALWVQSPPDTTVSGVCQTKLEDNLVMTAGIYPVLQKLAGNSVHAPFIASLALRLIDSGYIEKKAVDAADFISTAERLLPLLKKKKEEGGGYELDLVELIGSLRTPAAIELLREYLSVKNVALLKKVVLELLKDGQQVSPATMNRIAAESGIRAELYADLKKMKRTALFPGQYLTQAAFAEAAIYDAAENPEMDSVTIEFLKTKVALFGGKKYSFYLYRVANYSEGNPYETLGVAGGYDLAGAKLEPLPDLTGVYYDKALDTNHISVFLTAYLKKKAAEEQEATAP